MKQIKIERIENLFLIGMLFLMISTNLNQVPINIMDMQDEFQFSPENSRIIGSETTYSVNNVAVEGNFAYVTTGLNGLKVINISNPSNPTIVGQCDTFGDAMGIAVSGGIVYVLNGAGSQPYFRAINVSNPSNPVVIGSCNTGNVGNDISISGNIAYINNHLMGIQCINISDPTYPTIIGSWSDGGNNNIQDLEVNGNILYLAYYGSGLKCINISNPTNPIFISSKPIGVKSNIYGVSIAGLYAYVAADDEGFFSVDIRNPNSCVVLGNVPTPVPEAAVHVSISGNIAFNAINNKGVQIINISNPIQPSIIHTVDTPGVASHIALYGNIVCVSDNSAGLQCISIFNYIEPQYRSTYDSPGSANQLEISGTIGYLADYQSIQILNLSNPHTIQYLNNISMGGECNGVKAQGNLLFVADGQYGVKIFNISNPISLVQIGFYDTPGQAISLDLQGNALYIADGNAGIHILNISNPTAPQLKYTYDTIDWAMSIKVCGDRLYSADGANGGLYCFNISNPWVLQYLSNYNSPGNAERIDVYNHDLVYMGDTISGVCLINFSNPSSPQVAKQIIMSDAHAVKVFGSYLLVADGNSGLKIFNNSDILNPIQIGYFDTPGLSIGLNILQDCVFVIETTTGIHSLQLFKYEWEKPVFGQIEESADPVFLGNTVSINVTVTDAAGVNTVWIELEGMNYSMSHLSGNVWEYVWMPSTTGTKPYTIWANDTLGNLNSVSGSIMVQGNPGPTLSNVQESADPVVLGNTVGINVSVNDTDGIYTVWIELEGVNYTMWNMVGDVWAYDWMPSTTGTKPYTIWANDTFGNMNSVSGSISVQTNAGPTLNNIQESADPVVLGNTVAINVSVTDLDGIHTVWIGLEGVNHTMWNMVGDVWAYDWMPSTTGTKPYTIWANDTFGNTNSVSGSISVVSNSGPTLSNVHESADPVIVGNTVSINVTVTDMDGIDSVWIMLEGVNYTMWNVMGDVWAYDWIPTITGTKPYTIWANDTFGNMNSISGSLSVQSVVGPSISNVNENADPLELGNSETINALVSDGNGVSAVWIEFNGDNHTMAFVSGSTWRYAGWMPSSIGTYAYNIWANNSLGVESFFAGSITVQDTTAPAIFNIVESADPLILGDVEVITVEVTDFSGLQNVYLEFSGQNHTMVYLGGNTWRFDSWYPNSVGVQNYKIWARDNNGRLAVYTGNIMVQENSAEPPDENPDDGGTTGGTEPQNPFAVDGYPPSLLVVACIACVAFLKRKPSKGMRH